MGLSASQGRLLTLTSRLSDLELRAQTISNQKMRLTTSQTDAATRYQESLNLQKIMYNNGQREVQATVKNLTEFTSMEHQKYLVTNSGALVVDANIATIYDAHKGDLDGFVNAYITQKTGKEYTEGFVGEAVGKDPHKENGVLIDDTLVDEETARYNIESRYELAKYAKSIFQKMEANGYCAVPSSCMSDPQYLMTNFLNGNFNLAEDRYTEESYTYTDKDGTQKTKNRTCYTEYDVLNYQTDADYMYAESDESQIARAQAEYDTALAMLESKEKKLDLELDNIETEHSAIQQEKEGLEKVISSNTERTFKLFA
ncbi:MAG: hypothetical protein MJ229_06865 [bacterium]|nr:hypothetical protein [bacterium]